MPVCDVSINKWWLQLISSTANGDMHVQVIGATRLLQVLELVIHSNAQRLRLGGNQSISP